MAIHIGGESTECSFWASISARCHFSWVWLLSLAKAWIPWRKLVLWLNLLYSHFLRAFTNCSVRAGCESALSSRKFTIFQNLISTFYWWPQLGSNRFSSGAPEAKTLTQDFLLILMYFKGWLSFKSVKLQLCLARLY